MFSLAIEPLLPDGEPWKREGCWVVGSLGLHTGSHELIWLLEPDEVFLFSVPYNDLEDEEGKLHFSVYKFDRFFRSDLVKWWWTTT